MITRILISIFAVLAFSSSSSAQTLVSNFKSDNGLWGYMTIDEEIIIPAIYSAAKAFSSNGIALVKDSKTKKYIYIDLKGNKIELDHNPTNLKNFNSDRAVVIKDKKHGAINSAGELVI